MKIIYKLFVYLLLACSAISAEVTEERPVIIIPVYGEIEDGIVYVVERGINEAENLNAQALILHMDTYGGKVQAAEKIMQALSHVDIPTYTYVDTKAISAGALIAAATRYIYMAPQSQIGDAQIIQVSPVSFLGGAKKVDEGLKEKIYSATRAIVRSACERNDHDWKLFEAMMDEEVTISNIIDEGKLLTMTSKEAVETGLAEGISGNMSKFLESIELDSARHIKIKPSTGEKLSRFFSGMTISGILLLLGLGGLFIEFRTPGIGLPGAIGIICLSLFFWGHYSANLSGWIPVILFIIGIILLLLEILVIPGFGIPGISGIICVVSGLLLAMLEWKPGDWSSFPSLNELAVPLVVIALSFTGAVALIGIASKYIPAAPFTSRLFLSKKMDKKDGYYIHSSLKINELEGKTGVAKTTLRPAGKAKIGGGVFDVVSTGDFIKKGTQIKVIKIDNNHVIVEEDV